MPPLEVSTLHICRDEAFGVSYCSAPCDPVEIVIPWRFRELMDHEGDDVRENIPQAERPYAALSRGELRDEAVKLLGAAPRGPVSDEEYELHYEYIRRVRKEESSTHRRHSRRGVYDDERAAGHERLLDTLEEDDREIPCEGRVILLGGLSGAGKGTLLESRPELVEEGFALMNPDRIKVTMIEEGLGLPFDGLLPLESDELIRYEATVLDQRLVERALAKRQNIVIDRTMRSVKTFLKLRDAFDEHGYEEVRGIFVDVDPQEGYRRARARHRTGLDSYLASGQGLGERPIPGSVVVSSTPQGESPYRSTNAETFQELFLEGIFTATPRIFDGFAQEVSLPGLRRP